MKSNYTYTNKTITAQAIDGSYLWIAFTQSTDNTRHLYKVSAFDPSVVYFDIIIEATLITYISVATDYIYLGLSDAANIGAQITKADTTVVYIPKPVETEGNVIDMIMDTTNIYFLMDGNPTEVIVILKANLSYVDTITLARTGEVVSNAGKIDIDYYENIIVVSNLDSTPVLTKITKSTGNIYSYDSWSLS